MTYSPYSGEPIFSPGELLNFASRVAARTSGTVKEIYGDLCYWLGPHYWGCSYSFSRALEEVTPA